MIQAHRLLAEQKAELVELRVDWIQRRPDVGRLLKDRPTPVVVTCRRLQDKGKWFGTEEQRQAVLREAILAGADYVDIEEDIARSIPRYGNTKRIVSYHNFDHTPVDLAEIHRRMTESDPDIIKIVTMASVPADNVRMLELVRSATVPTVGFCMGDLGTVSRVLCGKMGAPFTYAGADRQGDIAPGQLAFADMRNIYHYDDITSATRTFGVIGDPIGHSLSPLLHNAVFRTVGFDGVYVPLRIPANVVAESLRAYEALDIQGYSVTIPHKHAALEFADVPDQQSERIGAANTLFRRDDQWHATNTDYSAIVETLQVALANNSDGSSESSGNASLLANTKALVLGAGGVARAAGCALRQQKAHVVITNRSIERAETLAAEFGCEVVNWDNRGEVACDILVNCTSVGMQPNVDETPFEEDWLNESMLVFDTVYTPEITKLISLARTRGCIAVSGLEMFVRQAAEQFRLFTGHAAPLNYMTETMRRSLAAVKH